jgi:hypothetical protein
MRKSPERSGILRIVNPTGRFQRLIILKRQSDRSLRSTSELIPPIRANHFVQQPKVFIVRMEALAGALATPLLAKADGMGPTLDQKRNTKVSGSQTQ